MEDDDRMLLIRDYHDLLNHAKNQKWSDPTTINIIEQLTEKIEKAIRFDYNDTERVTSVQLNSYNNNGF